jgi:hypothetical protein
MQIYGVFHNVLWDYKYLDQENQRTYLNGIVHSHRKTEKVFFFWQLEMFNVCTMGDRACIDTIFKFLPHMCLRGCIDILHCCNDEYRCTHIDACVWQELEYHIDACRVACGAHIEHLQLSKKKLFQFACSCEQFHYGRSFGFLVINICNHGEHYETPCM